MSTDNFLDEDDSPVVSKHVESKVKQVSVSSKEAKVLVDLLSLQGEKRSTESIKRIQECLKEVKFLQQYQTSIYYNQVLQNLELQCLPPDSVLFREGDTADQFYIILSGKIGLFISNSAKQLPPLSQSDVPESSNLVRLSTNLVENPLETQSKHLSQNHDNSAIEESKAKTLSFIGVGVKEIAQLSAGDAFGELGLLYNQTRTATAVCLESTNLLVLKKDVFEKYLSKGSNSKIASMEEFYKSFWIFKDIDTPDIRRLATRSTLNLCPTNTIIIKQGEIPKGVFFVRSGIVKIVATLSFRIDPINKSILDDYTDPSLEEKSRSLFKTINVQIDEIGQGSTFAATEVISNSEVEFTAVTATGSDILTIALADLNQTVSETILLELCEASKQYPSLEKIKRQYIENIQWQSYKNTYIKSFNHDLINTIRSDKPFDHRMPFLPRIPVDKYTVQESQFETDRKQTEQLNKRTLSTTSTIPQKKPQAKSVHRYLENIVGNDKPVASRQTSGSVPSHFRSRSTADLMMTKNYSQNGSYKNIPISLTPQEEDNLKRIETHKMLNEILSSKDTNDHRLPSKSTHHRMSFEHGLPEHFHQQLKTPSVALATQPSRKSIHDIFLKKRSNSPIRVSLLHRKSTFLHKSSSSMSLKSTYTPSKKILPIIGNISSLRKKIY